MQNFKDKRAAAPNRVAAGKPPVGSFPKLLKGFVSFESFVTKTKSYGLRMGRQQTL